MQTSQRKSVKLRLFDTHCHLDFEEFNADFDRYLNQAHQQGVERILIPSIGPQNWQRVSELAKSYPSIYYALGFHPCFLRDMSLSDKKILQSHLDMKMAKCVAIGECGLDRMIGTSMALQQKLFIMQLELAKEYQLPLLIHDRKSHDQLLKLLARYQFNHGGILHAFSGSEQQAYAFIERGFKIGVGGTITYPRAQKTRRTVAVLPLDCLVLETDAPSMPLNGYQGEINIPSRLPMILKELAFLKQKSEQKIAEIVWKNTHSIFNLPS